MVVSDAAAAACDFDNDDHADLVSINFVGC